MYTFHQVMMVHKRECAEIVHDFTTVCGDSTRFHDSVRRKCVISRQCAEKVRDFTIVCGFAICNVAR